MEITGHAVGIRFDTTKFPYGDAMQHAFEMICSVLSYAELDGVTVYGGFPYADEPYVYVVVLESTDYKRIRKIFTLLYKDASLSMFLTDDLPFIERNRLMDIKEIIKYGRYDYVKHKLPNAPNAVYNVKLSRSRNAMRGRKFRFMFAPDSFKGTISSDDAVRLLTLAAHETHYRGCNVVPMPIADGGEGTIDTVCSVIGGRTVKTMVHDPLGNMIEAEYAVINGDTALIEMAKASGLTLVPKDKRNARKTSSYGTGELIMHAINSGLRKVIVAVGGSATNDGGIGCAAAMGVRFLNKFGGEVSYCGDGLIFIRDIDTSHVIPGVRETQFTVMCDVDNPLTGLSGATMVYSEQKGADPIAMFELECGMKNYRRILNSYVGYDVCKRKGAGAAGGMGAMLMSLFSADVKHGIDTVLDITGFDQKLKNVSLIVTGEGRLDSQTISGDKTVAGILRRTNGKVPVAILCGSAQKEAVDSLSDTGVITLTHSFMDEKNAMENANELFYAAATNMFTLLKSGYTMKRR